MASKAKGVYSDISFYCINYVNAKRLHQMLLKLNLSSKIFSLRSGMNVVRINNMASKMRFIQEIGTNHLSKSEILKNELKKLESKIHRLKKKKKRP